MVHLDDLALQEDAKDKKFPFWMAPLRKQRKLEPLFERRAIHINIERLDAMVTHTDDDRGGQRRRMILNNFVRRNSE